MWPKLSLRFLLVLVAVVPLTIYGTVRWLTPAKRYYVYAEVPTDWSADILLDDSQADAVRRRFDRLGQPIEAPSSPTPLWITDSGVTLSALPYKDGAVIRFWAPTKNVGWGFRGELRRVRQEIDRFVAANRDLEFGMIDGTVTSFDPQSGQEKREGVFGGNAAPYP